MTNQSYWSGNIWMETMATDLFIDDHTYCKLVNVSDKNESAISQLDENLKSLKKINNKIDYMYETSVDYSEFDVQNCVEIDAFKERESSKTAPSNTSAKICCNDAKEDKNALDRIVKQDTVTRPIENETCNIYSAQNNICTEIENENLKSCTEEDATLTLKSASQNIELQFVKDTTRGDELSKYPILNSTSPVNNSSLLISENSASLSFSESQDALMSSSRDDSGIESFDSMSSEDSFFSTSSKLGNEYIRRISLNDHDYLIHGEDAVRSCPSKRKPIRESSTVNNSSSIEVENNEAGPRIKKCRTGHRTREVLVSEESPIIEGEFEETRRVTRHLVKTIIEKPVKKIDYAPGKLVWGYFRTSWWPALVIKAEDAGMIATPGKVWISWIGESRISELPEKYVDSFSSNLEARLMSLSTNPKNKVTSKKLKDEACFKTIQLLKKHFTGGALVRPYVSWMKSNILPFKDKLDKLFFYPYPENLSNKLDDLKKVNFVHNEKYLRQQEKERLNKVIEVKNSLQKVEKLEKPVEDGGINIMDQKPGMIVWAKMPGYSLWPCVIMNYQHLNRKQPNVAHQWVMWYGDYKYSQVEYRQILTFPTGIEKMETKIRSMKDDLFSKAVLQAAKDYCEQLRYLTEPWNLEDVIHLFYKSKDRFKLKNTELSDPNEEDLYSHTIKKQLRKQINNQPVSEERKQLILKSTNLQLVLSKKLPIESLCITCFESNEELLEHPFFWASMCNKCLEEFRPKIFAYGNDGKCFFCTLCGGDDLVAMCDSMNCPRVFCTACIKYIICPDVYEAILLKHPWYCFLCDASSLTPKKGVIKIRDDWRNRMISIYRINCDDKAPSTLERLDPNRKIRVLSLFDGIGTGLVVLKKLNIKVECYYSSEIDPDSMQVTFFNHGHEVIQLGDVRNIDDKKIKEITPIDLLIGGSPCNELSLANPKRRGLDDPEGSGVLFYDYCRIKKLVKKYNKKRHLFWLFENVASMPKKFRMQISENLGREPLFLDSADFSAQHRPRLYWGNLPWGPYQVNDVILQDFLRKCCNRQALVKKIMTVTTRTNSLNQTKENLKPVLMDGKKDMLWVTELEEIFGFPAHYTDANLQKTRRLQLIGKAWSVQTLTAIIRPIFYF